MSSFESTRTFIHNRYARGTVMAAAGAPQLLSKGLPNAFAKKIWLIDFCCRELS